MIILRSYDSMILVLLIDSYELWFMTHNDRRFIDNLINQGYDMNHMIHNS